MTTDYYGRPAIKRSHYRWRIISYFFVGGMAGSLQLIATLVDAVGSRRDRDVVRAGRWLALLGAMVCPVLLVMDLHYPRRWFNMLRIVRLTSPMNIGSWSLAAFGTCSGIAAGAELLDDTGLSALGRFATGFGWPAALFGCVLSIYTGSLLSATSVPLWASVPRLLPALFGASSVSTATALLSFFVHHRETARRLERVSLVSSLAQLVLGQLVEREWRRQGLAEVVEREPVRSAYQVGALGAGTVLPLAIHTLQTVTGSHSDRLSKLASICTLAGAYAERAVIVLAGNQSADDPRMYLQWTR